MQVLDHGYVRVFDTFGSDLNVVNAARVSYEKRSDNFSEKDRKLLRFLLNNDHTSPLRHAGMSFEIYAPLLVARQWWKYAVASTHLEDQNGWNESSRRYVTEEPVFYTPAADAWRSAPENSKQGSGEEMPSYIGEGLTQMLEEFYERGEQLYEMTMKYGIAPEQARLFLPAYGMYVRWVWTTSLQGVLHFLAQRLEHDSQWEIQQYAKAVASYVETAFPETYSAWAP